VIAAVSHEQGKLIDLIHKNSSDVVVFEGSDGLTFIRGVSERSERKTADEKSEEISFHVGPPGPPTS
jgi:hypothetical protein